MNQVSTQDKAKAIYAKYKAGGFDSDPAAKAQAATLLRKLIQPPSMPPLTGLPGSPPPAQGAPQQQNIDQSRGDELSDFFSDVRDKGLASATVDQIGLGLSNAQKALGNTISGAATIPGRLAALVSGDRYSPGLDQATRPPLTRSADALGKWISDNAPTQPNTPRTFFSGDLAEAGGSSAIMLGASLAGPEGPALIGGIQGLQGGLEQGQTAQNVAAAKGQAGPTNAQVALHALVTTGTGAAVGGALGTGIASGSLAKATLLPGAVSGLQGGLNAESAHEYLGAPAPTAGAVLRPFAVGGALGLIGHAVNPNPVQPDTLPGKVDVVTDPSARTLPTEVNVAREAGPPDLHAIVDHLRSLSPNTETGIARVPGDAAVRADAPAYDGPKSAEDMQGALWANDPNLRDLAVKHETVSNPTVKRQVRQELEDTLKQKLTDDQVGSIVKWRYWAQDHTDETKAALEKAQPGSTEVTKPITLGETLPAPENIQAVSDAHDTWMADRDEGQGQARVRAAGHEDDLRQITPPETLPQMWQRMKTGARVPQAYSDLNKAILFNIDLRGKAQEEYAKYGSKLSLDDQRIYDLSQNLPKGAQDLADKIKSENDEQGQMAQDAGVIHEARENYIARLWKQEQGPPAEGQSKFTTTTGRFKARSYSSVLQGLAEGRGLAVEGAIDSQRVASEQVHQAIADNKLLQLGMKTGQFSTHQQDGWAKIEHPNFRVSKPIADTGVEDAAKPLSRDVYRDDNGTAWERQDVYAPKDVADRYNTLLNSKSYLDKFATVRTLTALNGVAKAAELTMGLFHYRAIVNAFVHGSPLEMSDIAHPLRTYQDTQAAMNDGVDKPLLGKFFRAGMTLGRQQDYAEARMVDGARINAAFDEKLGNLGWTGDRVIEAKNVLTSVVQSQHDFLFHDFIPTIKWLSAKREYLYQMEKNKQALLDGKISEDDIIGGIAATHNNRFQSQNLFRMERDPAAQQVARLTFLAPDWIEGLARFTASGVRGTLPGANFEQQLARQTWGRILTRAAVGSALGNVAIGMLDKRSLKDRFSDAYTAGGGGVMGVLKGTYDIDWTPIYKALGGKDNDLHYLSSLMQYRDPIRFAQNPGQETLYKLSPLANVVKEGVTGTDYAGRPLTTWREMLGIDDKGLYSKTERGPDGNIHVVGEPKGGQLEGQTASDKSESKGGRPVGYEQMPTLATRAVGRTLPLSMQNVMAALAGRMDWAEAAVKALGERSSTVNLDAVQRANMLEDERKAKSIGELRAKEAQLKVFNKEVQLKKMGGH